MSVAESLEPETSQIALPLSARQLQILFALSEGKRIGEIGSALYMSSSTVKTHVYQMYRRLGVTSAHGAVAKGYQLGLLHLPEAAKEKRYWLLDARGDRITHTHSLEEARKAADMNSERVRKIVCELRWVTPWESIPGFIERTP